MATTATPDVRGLVVVERRDEGGAPLIVLSGELDFWTLEHFETALQSALQEQPRLITLDLTELRFIDSSGIGVLATALVSGTPIRLRRPTPAVQRVLQFTGLDGYLPIER